jgi:hypothetical protein
MVVVLLSSLKFYLMSLGMIVLNAIMGVKVGVDVVTAITT